MRFTDPGSTDHYVAVTLACGHEQQVDPVVLEANRSHLFWCPDCVELKAVVR